MRSSVTVLVLALLALTPVASAGGRTLVIHPGQQLHVAGSRVHCGVKPGSTGILTTCLIVKTGTQLVEGYGVGIDDKIAGVTHVTGSTIPTIFVRAQPSAGPVSAAGSATGTITAQVGDKIDVAGSNVVLFVSTLRGVPFLAGWVAGKDQQPLDHSYLVGISDAAVNIQQWHAGKTTPVFVKRQPRQ